MQRVAEPSETPVQTESDAADSFIRSRFTGHFLDPKIETEYREWLSKKNLNGLCILMLILGGSLTAASAIAINNQHSFKGQFVADFPEVGGSVTSTTFIARGGVLAIGVLLLLPSVRRAWTGRWYELYTLVALVAPVYVELVPVVISVIQRMANAETLAKQISPSNDSVVGTCSGFKDGNPVHATRSAYWSCTTSDFMLMTYSKVGEDRIRDKLQSRLTRAPCAAVPRFSLNLRSIGRCLSRCPLRPATRDDPPAWVVLHLNLPHPPGIHLANRHDLARAIPFCQVG